MNTRSHTTLPVVITIGLALALPSLARAAAPPEEAEPVAVVPVTGPPALPPPSAPNSHYGRMPARDLVPPDPNRGLGLTIAGFSTFGVAYIPALAFGAGGVPLLAIPVAGPFIAGGSLLSLAPVLGVGGGLGTLLIIDGVAQIVGLSLGIAGSVTLSHARREARLSASPGGLRLQF